GGDSAKARSRDLRRAGRSARAQSDLRLAALAERAERARSAAMPPTLRRVERWRDVRSEAAASFVFVRAAAQSAILHAAAVRARPEELQSRAVAAAAMRRRPSASPAALRPLDRRRPHDSRAALVMPSGPRSSWLIVFRLAAPVATPVLKAVAA